MTDNNFDNLLAKADPDRRLAALFAPPEQRERLYALYAFNHELGRIADATSESLIGEMKLTWWRDAVADLYADPPQPRRHDVTEALAGLIGRLPVGELQALVDARFEDISARPFETLDDVLDYVDATAVRLMRLGSIACEAEIEPALLVVAGRAWGLTGLLRAFPHRASIGRAPVGGDALGEAGATPAMLAQGLGAEKVAEARRPVVDAARDAARDLDAAGAMPPEAVPVIGYARLAGAYLDRLPANPYQLAPETNPLGRRLRMAWLSLTGR